MLPSSRCSTPHQTRTEPLPGGEAGRAALVTVAATAAGSDRLENGTYRSTYCGSNLRLRGRNAAWHVRFRRRPLVAGWLPTERAAGAFSG
jgi:hypothetical protein